MNITRSRVVPFGALLLVLSVIGFLVVEFIVANAWQDPAYNYAYNNISDLGVETESIISGREVLSPMHQVFNWMCPAFGILFVIGFFCMNGLIQGQYKILSMSMIAIAGIGIAMIGFFPSVAGNEHIVHEIFAIMAIFGGSLGMIFFGVSQLKDEMAFFGRMSILLGIFNFVWIAFMKFYNFGYSGLFERLAIYSIFLFAVVLAIRGVMINNKTPNDRPMLKA